MGFIFDWKFSSYSHLSSANSSCCCCQLLSPVWLFATLWTAACQTSLSFTDSQNLLKLFSIESVMPSNHCILCRPLLFLPSIFPSIRVFSNESAPHIRWPKYWSFTFSISPSREYSGLISFRIDWFDHCLMNFCFSEYEIFSTFISQLLYIHTLYVQVYLHLHFSNF